MIKTSTGWFWWSSGRQWWLSNWNCKYSLQVWSILCLSRYLYKSFVLFRLDRKEIERRTFHKDSMKYITKKYYKFSVKTRIYLPPFMKNNKKKDYFTSKRNWLQLKRKRKNKTLNLDSRDFLAFNFFLPLELQKQKLQKIGLSNPLVI